MRHTAERGDRAQSVVGWRVSAWGGPTARFASVAPGAVLAGLVKRIRKEIPVISIGKAEDFAKLS